MLHHFLGVTVEHRPSGMFLHQRQYTLDILERAGMTACNPCSTPVNTIRVYLIVVDIRIVDCHMYPGEPCTPSHVLLYIPAKASMQYIPLYTNPIILHGITSLGSNPRPQTLVFRCSRRRRPSFSRRRRS